MNGPPPTKQKERMNRLKKNRAEKVDNGGAVKMFMFGSGVIQRVHYKSKPQSCSRTWIK